MSRNTVTLTAPNGAKVRTVHSRRYFVVSYGSTNYVGYDTETQRSVYSEEYRHTAHVAKRTDSAIAAEREAKNGHSGVVVFEVVSRNGERQITDVTDVIARRAAAEKRQKKARQQEVNRYGRGY